MCKTRNLGNALCGHFRNEIDIAELVRWISYSRQLFGKITEFLDKSPFSMRKSIEREFPMITAYPTITNTSKWQSFAAKMHHGIVNKQVSTGSVLQKQIVDVSIVAKHV